MTDFARKYPRLEKKTAFEKKEEHDYKSRLDVIRKRISSAMTSCKIRGYMNIPGLYNDIVTAKEELDWLIQDFEENEIRKEKE